MNNRIYLASSWRNPKQTEYVEKLRLWGFEVYDFKNPPGRTGFNWRELDENWQNWNAETYVKMLETDIARAGFYSDMGAMAAADICVLLTPCGRSAHIEAGWMKGQGKALYVLFEDGQEPELMLAMADKICTNDDDLREAIEANFFFPR